MTTTIVHNRLLNAKQFRNVIINGGFDVWQRGLTHTNIDSVFTADRWLGRGKNEIGGSSVVNVNAGGFTLGQTLVPGEPRFYLSYQVQIPNAGEVGYVRTTVEGVRTFAGQQATLSFWARSSVSMTGSVYIEQLFGTGGSPSANVVAFNQSQAWSTSWTKYTYTLTLPSLAGKTLGTNNNNALAIVIATAINTVCTLDLAQVQFELGPEATAFEIRPPQQELALCQRYYERGFSIGYVRMADGAPSFSWKVAGSFIVQKPYNPTVRLLTTSITLDNPGVASYTFNSLAIAETVAFTTGASLRVGGTGTGAPGSVMYLCFNPEVFEFDAEL